MLLVIIVIAIIVSVVIVVIVIVVIVVIVVIIVIIVIVSITCGGTEAFWAAPGELLLGPLVVEKRPFLRNKQHCQ